MDDMDDANPELTPELANATAAEVPRLRAMVVDDQVAVREMVAMVLEGEGTFAVVAGASSGLEGLRLFRLLRPTLVVAGLALPEMNGAEMIRAMRAEGPEARVLVFSGTRNAELIRAGLGCRAHGFVHKTEPLETLRQGCAAVARGMSFFGPFATRVRDAEGATEEPSLAACLGAACGMERLTPRERSVLQLVAEGLSTKQVAARLAIAPKTAEHHRGQLMQKLGLRDVASLTRYAVRCGLVEG